MFRWIPYAMVRIAAFFIAGILLGIYQPNIISFNSAKIILFTLIALYVLVYWIVTRKRRTVISGVLGLFAIFFAGYVHLLLFVDWNQPDHLSTYKGEIKYSPGRSAPTSTTCSCPKVRRPRSSPIASASSAHATRI